MQTLFLRGPSATLRMIILVIVSITIMTIDQRWHHLEGIRNALSLVIDPLRYTINLPIRLYYWGDETLSTHQTLLDQYRELKDLHLQSRIQLQKLDILERENARLRTLMSATPKLSEKTLIAEIINVDVDPYRHLIILNKSSKNDVYVGQPVIDAQGIMGQILHVNAWSSTAMLLTDASHAIPVQIDRTGLRAIAFGTGKIDLLDLRYIPHNADIKEGDVLISSGLGGHFPPNYPVAKITEIERPAGETFAVVKAEPLALLDRSREVLLVWHSQQLLKIQQATAKEEAIKNEKTEEEKINKDIPDQEEAAAVDGQE